jgi:hypothetical protein
VIIEQAPGTYTGDSQLISAIRHAYENGAFLLSADWARLCLKEHGYYDPELYKVTLPRQESQKRARKE